MSTYNIRHQAPNNQPLPSLFTDLCSFIASQPDGTLGWFDTFGPESIPVEWEPAVAERLNANGFAFLQLPDGSFLVLLDTGVTGAPRAVVFLGSEGDYRTVANSLEEFLILWSTGETGISELDDAEISGRDELAAWIKNHGLQPPQAAEFDFGAWLDGDTDVVIATSVQTNRKHTADYQQLGPKMRELADMMGRRADDAVLIAWVTKTLGKKVPAHTSSDSANVVAPKAGLELVFSHNVLNEKYPLVKKSARSFIPYLSHAWVREKIGEPIFGLDVKRDTEAAVIQALGEPDGRRPRLMSDTKPEIAYWHRVVDAGADVVVKIESDAKLRVEVSIMSSRALREFMDTSTHLFVGWAALNGLLDEARFAQHADLLSKVRNRQVPGAALVKAALSRGLWDSHLLDKPGLRRRAYQWFHNLANLWITKDLIKIFGAREGPYGHDEPKLDDDHWDKVDMADKAFKKVFGQWIQ